MSSTLPSAADITAKQVQRTAAATQAYTAGVQRVQVAPGQLAAAAQQKYINGVQANVGKWANNVASVSLSAWAQAAINKGAPRLGTGVTAAQGKIQAFWTRFLPQLSAAQQQVRAMPTDTFEQRVQRSVQMQTLLHQSAAKG